MKSFIPFWDTNGETFGSCSSMQATAPNMEMELAIRGAELRSCSFADSMSAAARSSFPIRYGHREMSRGEGLQPQACQKRRLILTCCPG